jgi:hypothetical protein
MKRWLFRLAALALALAAIEGVSAIAYTVVVDRTFSFSRLSEERARLLAEAPGETNARRLLRDWLGFEERRPLEQVGAEVLHPYLGFVYSPERDTGFFRANYDMGISRWGFVDNKEPLQAAAPNRVIVGVFGGSVAWYLTKESEEALVRGLKAVPAWRDKDVVIVRAALFGYKQPQQLMALAYLLAMGAHFDLVVNLDGFNEIVLPVVENLDKQVFPFYPRSWFIRVADSPTSRQIVDRVTSLRAERRRLAELASSPVARYSATANLAWKLADMRVANQIAAEQMAWLRQPMSDGGYAASGPFAPYPGEAETYADLAAKWREASEQMSRLARGNGIPYVHFLQPNQYVEGSKVLTADERAVAIDETFVYARPARTGYPYLISAGRELARDGVWFEDLTPIFKNVTASVYRDNCCHLDKRGNDLMARAMTEAIARRMQER